MGRHWTHGPGGSQGGSRTVAGLSMGAELWRNCCGRIGLGAGVSRETQPEACGGGNVRDEPARAGAEKDQAWTWGGRVQGSDT